MIVRLYHTFTEFKEINIEGYHLPNILNRLRRLHSFDASKERAIMFLVDSSKRLEPLQIIGNFDLQDVSFFDRLDILLEHNFKNIEGEDPMTLMILLSGIAPIALGASGVLGLSQNTLNTIFSITDWIVTVVGAVASIFNPYIGLALSLWYALVKFAAFYGASDPAQLQADAQQYQSNLYNGVPLLREQGGICPLIFGQPYASGVLLSSALVTSDQVA